MSIVREFSCLHLQAYQPVPATKRRQIDVCYGPTWSAGPMEAMAKHASHPHPPSCTYIRIASRFKLAWNETAETGSELMYMTISARGIETQGMIVSGHALTNQRVDAVTRVALAE